MSELSTVDYARLIEKEIVSVYLCCVGTHLIYGRRFIIKCINLCHLILHSTRQQIHLYIFVATTVYRNEAECPLQSTSMMFSRLLYNLMILSRYSTYHSATPKIARACLEQVFIRTSIIDRLLQVRMLRKL